MNKSKTTAEFDVHLRANGIIYVCFKPNTHITIEMQERMIEAYWEVTDINRPFIFEAGEFISISKEARLNAIKIEEKSPVLASAIIVKNLAQKILGEYYYKFNRPKNPVKLFTNVASAEEWIIENFPLQLDGVN